MSGKIQKWVWLLNLPSSYFRILDWRILMNKRIRNRDRIFAVALVLALVTMACGLNLPVTQIKTGPTQTVDIRVPMPEEGSTGVELNLEFLAGELKLAPGASGNLASGTATFNTVDFKPKIDSNGSSYTLRMGEQKIEGVPNFQGSIKNIWDLHLANKPMSLNIKAGAYNGNFELGGLSLEKLAISEGGSDLTSTFSAPNNVVMSSFTFSTGGSTMLLKGLANANFEQMNFKSGAGDYTLSFDGNLQRDASVTIESGASTVNIIVPESTNAQVSFEGGLTAVNAGSAWSQNGNVYQLSGSSPTITITVKMGVGTLNLKTE
jgi:hypothetical protein